MKDQLEDQQQELQQKNSGKFLNRQVKDSGTATAPLTREYFFEPGTSYPLVIECSREGVQLNQWASTHKAGLRASLLKHGAILFRNFNTHSLDSFRSFVDSLGYERMEYQNRTSPRSAIADKVYTSTDHPADQIINMHNELSYSRSWPMQILFFCVQPTDTGGETPIADSRKVLELLSGETRKKFAEKGVMYVRNMITGLGLSWREVYQTDDPAVVEAYCRTHDTQFRWKDKDHLKTSWVSPAERIHPVTGEATWFNHGFFYNVLSLDPMLREVFAEEDLPFSTFYGDGSRIETAVIGEIARAFETAKSVFPWVKGDILLLDNMLMAHGRNSFAGNRKIAVAMCEPHHGVNALQSHDTHFPQKG